MDVDSRSIKLLEFILLAIKRHQFVGIVACNFGGWRHLNVAIVVPFDFVLLIHSIQLRSYQVGHKDARWVPRPPFRVLHPHLELVHCCSFFQGLELKTDPACCSSCTESHVTHGIYVRCSNRCWKNLFVHDMVLDMAPQSKCRIARRLHIALSKSVVWPVYSKVYPCIERNFPHQIPIDKLPQFQAFRHTWTLRNAIASPFWDCIPLRSNTIQQQALPPYQRRSFAVHFIYSMAKTHYP